MNSPLRYFFVVIVSVIFIAGFEIAHGQSGKRAAAKDKSVECDFNRIEIFRGQPPKRSFKTLGRVEIEVPQGMGRAQAITLVKKEACKRYRADAVIDVVVIDEKIGETKRKMVCPGSQPDCYVEGPEAYYRTKATGTAVKWK